MIIVFEADLRRRAEYYTIFEQLAEEVLVATIDSELDAWLRDSSRQVDMVIGDLEVIQLAKKLRPAAALLPVTRGSSPPGSLALLSTASDDFPKELKVAVKKALTNRLVRAVVYRVSHEINNPATVILGNADLAATQHGSELPERVKQLLAEIERQALRIGKVTHALNHLNPEDMEIIYEAAVPMISLPED